jgi:hypothetical protein
VNQPGTVLAWPRSSADADEVRRTVEDVLREPAFTAAQDTWLAGLRDDIRQWFLERLQDLFSSGAGTVLAWVLVGLAVVVGLAVAVRALQGTRRGATASDGPAAVVVSRRPPADWLADARAAQAAGDLGEAVRCGYRAVVASLAGAGALEEVPGRTVGEYRTQVADHRPDRLDDFTRASDVFERVWYARRPATGDDVRAVVTVAEALADGRRGSRVGAGTGAP